MNMKDPLAKMVSTDQIQYVLYLQTRQDLPVEYLCSHHNDFANDQFVGIFTRSWINSFHVYSLCKSFTLTYDMCILHNSSSSSMAFVYAMITCIIFCNSTCELCPLFYMESDSMSCIFVQWLPPFLCNRPFLYLMLYV